MAVVKKVKGKLSSKKKKRDSDDEDDDAPQGKFELAKELTEPSDRLEDYIILLTGEKKIGKTSLANQFGDKAYVLATERGYGGLRLLKSDIPDWRTAKQAARALKKSGKKYGPIIVDTVDKLYTKCEKYICEKLAINDLSDEEWGKGYSACRREFDNLITELSDIGVGLILISHTEEKTIKRRSGGEYDRIVPTMSNQARKVIEPLVDIWTYYMYDGDRRVLVIQGDDHISAGHRLGERFRTPAGKPVKQIDMGRSAKSAFKHLIAAFNNQYTPPDDEEEEDEPRKKKSFKLRSA